MDHEPFTSRLALVMAVSKGIDLISPLIANHQLRVAYAAYMIGQEMGLDDRELEQVVIAGALHDCGALSMQDRIAALEFEMANPEEHATNGYRLLSLNRQFQKAAHFVRYHHHPWNEGDGRKCCDETVPLQSHLIHLADRVTVLFDANRPALFQTSDIIHRVKANEGRIFAPRVCRAFYRVGQLEHFWLEVTSGNVEKALLNTGLAHFDMTCDDVEDLANLFCHVVDFRSRFTSTHSSGVAAVAEAMAKIANMTEQEVRSMKVAGFFHDMGKLVIPSEILDSPNRVDLESFRYFKSHSYYTYKILEVVPAMETINRWASFHHERLDGNGYPFHLKADELPTGSRILAIADCFTAMTEDRPYRKGMPVDQAQNVLTVMAKHNAIDARLLEIFTEELGRIDRARADAQSKAAEKYTLFQKDMAC